MKKQVHQHLNPKTYYQPGNERSQKISQTYPNKGIKSVYHNRGNR